MARVRNIAPEPRTIPALGLSVDVDEVFDVLEWRPVGTRHLKLTLRAPGAAAPVGAIHFGGWTGSAPPPRVHAAYQLEPDDWNGRRGVQLLIRHLAPA